jgi:class 3 adenylate cyclase
VLADHSRAFSVEVSLLPKPELACFVIADISGYTNFLSAAELDHAQDIVADFMDTVVKGLRPSFRLAKYEGDAAFVYAASEKVDSSLLQDTIEQAYFKFRRRLRDVKQASVCTCKACAAMADLDFKFVVHRGEMVKQKMGGREELAGRDVILVHRLLKNTVNEKLGGRAYVLFSDACFESAAIDPAAQGLIEHHETFDILGDNKLWLRDLEVAWVKETARTRIEVTEADAYATLAFDIPAPRQTAWEYITVPGQWQKWWPADAIIENTSSGRRGVGTENHCMHGKDAIIETVLDWRPFDYFTVGIVLPTPGTPKIIMTRALRDGPAGITRLEMRVAKPRPKDKDFVDRITSKFAADITGAMETLRLMLESQPSSGAWIDEPAAMTSNQRFLTQPVNPPQAPNNRDSAVRLAGDAG